MEKAYSILLAVIVGVSVALQGSINAELGKYTNSKIAALFSFLVGTIILLGINLFSNNIKTIGNVFKAPPYLVVGGILGVIIVFFTIKVMPVLGAGATLSIIVITQVITGIAIDHFGLFGVDKQPLTVVKAVGVALLFIGVRLIVK
ncbi:MAG: DMT family transporter [Clostridia bacterium]|nr:DMT family transporter [Clostridia bacterium]